MRRPPPEPFVVRLEIRNRGEKCPRRGIPLVDIYLSGSDPKGPKQGLWMWQGGVTEVLAKLIAEWFAAYGAEVAYDGSATENPIEALF